ncbi:hypothetical protein O6H91_Y311600 [Diphasiastrum complanatum]|nr:hypothetical protein O6H91_Y311600 [Diphasiastrum complanatum]
MFLGRPHHRHQHSYAFPHVTRRIRATATATQCFPPGHPRLSIHPCSTLFLLLFAFAFYTSSPKHTHTHTFTHSLSLIEYTDLTFCVVVERGYTFLRGLSLGFASLLLRGSTPSVQTCEFSSDLLISKCINLQWQKMKCNLLFAIMGPAW